MIEQKYLIVSTTPSDINEHLPTLRKYAQQCDSVAEFGVRAVVSTWAFLKGLKDGIPGTKKLICVDISRSPNISEVEHAAKLVGIKFEFIQNNDLHVDLNGGVDLLFIDTWHVYGQLKRELEKHAPCVKKFIALHDTEIDAIFGETIRVGWDSHKQSIETGIPENEINKGLREAITEFIAKGDSNGGKWEVAEHFYNNNGLTVLKRVA